MLPQGITPCFAKKSEEEENFPAGTLLEGEMDHSTHKGGHKSENHEMQDDISLYESLDHEWKKIKREMERWIWRLRMGHYS